MRLRLKVLFKAFSLAPPSFSGRSTNYRYGCHSTIESNKHPSATPQFRGTAKKNPASIATKLLAQVAPVQEIGTNATPQARGCGGQNHKTRVP